MKKYAIMKLTDDYPFDSFGNGKVLSSPVELMKEACKEAGVKISRIVEKGDAFLRPFDMQWVYHLGEIYDFSSNDKRLVIPAQPQEPCPNCQNAKDVSDVAAYLKHRTSPQYCEVCDRPESEWTYAQDSTDDPQTWIGGVI